MITRESFGRTPEGSEVYLYTLSNNSKVSAKITNFGGIIQSLFALFHLGVAIVCLLRIEKGLIICQEPRLIIRVKFI